MFWEAVKDGLLVLTFWETYIGILIYFAFYITPLMILWLVMGKNEAFGCVGFLIIPFFNIFATIIFIVSISPIILGFSEDATWLLPWFMITTEPLVILKIIGILFVVSIFVPIDSLRMIIMGGICLTLILKLLNIMYPEIGISQINPIPSLFYLVGFLVISGISTWVGIIALSFIGVVIEDKIDEDLAEYILLPISLVFGFIPIFIYGSWLGNQIWL